jgi:hypothetical protein|tara:strand:+ start:4169 stop:4432 length:264 start_codon:yes stop_codon:yes gene_type:complete
MLVPNKYIRRASSTIPFGYELSPIDGYLKPISDEISILKEVAESVNAGEISLGIGVDWLEAETGRKISRMGLKKHVDKVYGRLGKKS